MLGFVFFLFSPDDRSFVSTIGGETKAAGENQAETVTATRTHIAGMPKTRSPQVGIHFYLLSDPL